MISSASLFLALRYLQPKRSFVSTITMISVLGIMLGVGVLIVVISVMKGFEIEFRNLLLGFEPHIVIEQLEPIRDNEGQVISRGVPWQQVRDKIKTLPGTNSVAPFAAGMSFLKYQSNPQAIEVHSFDPADAPDVVQKLQKQIVEGQGSFDLSSSNNLVLSDSTANQLGIRVGDKVTLYASTNLKEVFERFDAVEKLEDEAAKAKAYDEMNELVVPRELHVVGLLNSETTGERNFVPLDVGAELMNPDGTVRAIGLELKDGNQVAEFKALLQEQLPDDWQATTWMERWSQRLAAVQNERVMMWFVLSFVILVAAFSVMNTTITVTVQKRREIGILTALGASVKQIVGVFMLQAMVVAVLGTVLGWLGGLIFLHFRNNIRSFLAESLSVDVFPSDIYALSSIPSHTLPSDLILICSTSVVLCLLGAFFPAYFAARVDPAVALRD
jgi:lipoprotein-releasing system permease protein